MRNDKISPFFNGVSRGRALNFYVITLTKPDGNPDAQAGDFSLRLSRWLSLQGDDFKGNAEAPGMLPSEGRNARLSIRCTEETLARVERQFAGDILRTDPPAKHARGAVYPKPVDPWDVSKW